MAGTSLVAVGGARLEVLRIDARGAAAAPIVMLHEGLGSVAMWKDFPHRVAHATGRERRRLLARGLRTVVAGRAALRRPLHARRGADRAAAAARRAGDRRAGAVRPQRRRLDRADPRGGVGTAGRRARADGAARVRRGRLGRQHRRGRGSRGGRPTCAPGSRATTTTSTRAFTGWNDIWLHPDFRAWNIEDCARALTCPVLAMQGRGRRVRHAWTRSERIARAAPDVELVELADCRHSPHRDQPDAVLAALARFVDRLGR